MSTLMDDVLRESRTGICNRGKCVAVGNFLITHSPRVLFLKKKNHLQLAVAIWLVSIVHCCLDN